MDPIHGLYRNMLLDVANCIEDSDLQRMKFRCDQIIKKAESQRIKDSTQFFVALEQREHLGPRNLEFLKDILRNCCHGKVDGLRTVEQYERELGIQGTAPPQHPQIQQINNGYPAGNQHQPQVIYVMQDNTHNGIPRPPAKDPNLLRYGGPDLSKEIAYLTRSLGRDWRFFVRALGVAEEDIENIIVENRTVKERIHQSLQQWLLKEQQGASKYKLIEALRDSSVQRNDLASTMEDGAYT